MKYYYSEFVIRNSSKKYVDLECYSMNIKKQEISQPNSQTKTHISWYTRVSQSVSEYTHLAFAQDETDRTNPDSTHTEAIQQLITKVQKAQSSQDTVRFGFVLHRNSPNIPEKRLSKIICSKMQKLLKTTEKRKKQPISSKPIQLIVVKETNWCMSRLGIHHDILNVFLHYFESSITISQYNMKKKEREKRNELTIDKSKVPILPTAAFILFSSIVNYYIRFYIKLIPFKLLLTVV